MNLNGTKPFGLHLDATLKVIKQDMLRRFKAHRLDLTPEQYAVLAELMDKGSLSQKELAQSTFKDAPTVSRIIDLLVKKGWIERITDADDRRKCVLLPTAEGQKVYASATPVVQEARQAGWQGLSDDDYRQLKTILDKVVENIQP